MVSVAARGPDEMSNIQCSIANVESAEGGELVTRATWLVTRKQLRAYSGQFNLKSKSKK